MAVCTAAASAVAGANAAEVTISYPPPGAQRTPLPPPSSDASGEVCLGYVQGLVLGGSGDGEDLVSWFSWEKCKRRGEVRAVAKRIGVIGREKASVRGGLQEG